MKRNMEKQSEKSPRAKAGASAARISSESPRNKQLQGTRHLWGSKEMGGALFWRDRNEAGEQLAIFLESEMNAGRLPAPQPRQNGVILGIPRGAVPIARKVAERLGVDWDVLIAHKVASPSWPEYAIGAVTASGLRVGFSSNKIEKNKVPEIAIASEIRRLQKRREHYQQLRPSRSLQGKWVCLVDDGIATGWTSLAALREAKRRGATSLILAVPVIAPTASLRLAPEVDHLLALSEPEDFSSVGQFYQDFSPVTDDEVDRLLVS